MFVLFISLFHYKFHYRIALTGNVESWLPSCGRNLCRNSVGYHLSHHVAVPSSKLAAIMVNKFFIRINFNMLVLCCKFTRIARNVFILLLNKNSQTTTTKTQQQKPSL